MNAHPRLQSYTCPCCKGFIGEAAPIEAVIEAESTPMGRAILQALSAPVGRRMTAGELIESIYPANYKPADPPQVFRVLISRLRKRLETFGWMIKTEGSHGAQYRLLPIGGDR